MKQPGYLLTVKLFIPAPKTDFKAQASAANFAASALETKTLSPELLTAAKVISVDGKFGTAEIDTGGAVESVMVGATGAEAAEAPVKRGRPASA